MLTLVINPEMATSLQLISGNFAYKISEFLLEVRTLALNLINYSCIRRQSGVTNLPVNFMTNLFTSQQNGEPVLCVKLPQVVKGRKQNTAIP